MRPEAGALFIYTYCVCSFRFFNVGQCNCVKHYGMFANTSVSGGFALQGYTQYGGLRPFGVSLLYAGWDKIDSFQLYQSNPSGNYDGCVLAPSGLTHSKQHSVVSRTTSELDFGRASLHRCGDNGCHRKLLP